MNVADNDLYRLWQGLPLDYLPYILPEDRPFIPLDSISEYRSFDEYAMSSTFGRDDDTSFHTGLLPTPYAGDLHQASVYILMLNPGLSPGDYFADQNASFREARIKTLRQELHNEQYPFIFLNPHLAWCPGSGYWQKKLRDIVVALAKHRQITYQVASGHLAQNLACLELVPYHSKHFGAGALLKNLKSTQAAVAFVHEVLLPKVRSGDATIIVTRSAKHWRLPKHKRIVIYDGAETRSAHINLQSRGGKAIAAQLGL